MAHGVVHIFRGRRRPRRRVATTSMPCLRGWDRIRVATDWLYGSILPPESTQLSAIRPEDAQVATAKPPTSIP